jgi:hypothetical protein
MGTCKLCHQERDLIRAHIIPAAFHRQLQTDTKQPPLVISNNSTVHPKRSPGGLYDENLLCNECEHERFEPWDRYAAECFIHGIERDGRPFHPTENLALVFDSWDQRKLRMFAISLIWRAAVTDNPIFNRVTMGPHEERARQFILQGDPGSPDDFSVVLARWVARPEYAGIELTQFSPYCSKLEGINSAKFFLGGVIIHVKCDKRPFADPFPELFLKPDRPVLMVTREIEGSKDILAVRPGLEGYAARLRARRRRQ